METIFSDIKMLIVDDSVEFRQLISAYLKSYPIVIQEADDGLYALEMMKENHYDVVLMDFKMPLMDGATATKLYREWENGNQRVKIIALSAFSRKQDLEDFYQAGCDTFMAKPVKRQDLVQALSELIEKRRN